MKKPPVVVLVYIVGHNNCFGQEEVLRFPTKYPNIISNMENSFIEVNEYSGNSFFQ